MAIGLLLAVLTGLSWVVTGAVVVLVERHGRPTGQLLAVRSALLLVTSLLLLAAGLAAIASPVMVASCLAGFLIYGAIALRERPNLYQSLGILCSLGGIALLAMQ